MPMAVESDRMTVAQVVALMEAHFPHLHEGSGRLSIEDLPPMAATVRMHQDARMMRPGGTVSGPAMFKLADFSVYAAILGELGPTAIEAVTTNMTINFLARPEPADMVARTRLIKLGRRLAVAEVQLYSGAGTAMVAHATSTYVLPPPLSG